MFGTADATYVRRRVGEEYKPECVVPTIKHGGGSIMVWGCISEHGVGEIVVCEGQMDSKSAKKCFDSGVEENYSTRMSPLSVEFTKKNNCCC